MDKKNPHPLRPILGGTKNGIRPERYSYWRTGYAGNVPEGLEFWVAQAGEYHSDKPFFAGNLEHTHLFQFYYHLEGEAKVSHDGGEYEICQGDLVIIPNTVDYAYQSSSGIRLHWFGLSGDFPFAKRYNKVTRLPLGQNQLLESVFNLMREVLILNRPGSTMRAVSLVYELLALIESIQAPPDENAAYPDSVRVALSYMRENFQRPFVADEIARICGVTAPHLRSLFQKWVGETPHQSHTRFRIEAAERLLISENLPVGEIASQVGYEDPYYFSRVFKKRTGVRPSKFRELLENEETKLANHSE